MVTRASPKRAGDGTFFTALPAKVEEERDVVVAAIGELRKMSAVWVLKER